MRRGCIAGTAGNVSENGPQTVFLKHDVKRLREQRGWRAITDCADAHILWNELPAARYSRLKVSAKVRGKAYLCQRRLHTDMKLYEAYDLLPTAVADAVQQDAD